LQQKLMCRRVSGAGVRSVTAWMEAARFRNSTKVLALTAAIGVTGVCVDALANFPLQMPGAGRVCVLAGCVTALGLLAGGATPGRCRGGGAR